MHRIPCLCVGNKVDPDYDSHSKKKNSFRSASNIRPISQTSYATLHGMADSCLSLHLPPRRQAGRRK